MKTKPPAEIVASLLAAATAFIGGNWLNLPTWAIFVAWAGTFLMGGPSAGNIRKLWLAMPAGSTFALAIVFCDTHAGTMFGDGQVAKDSALALFIFVFNTALMYTGRTELFSLIPGMFFGFACYFATYFGGFGFRPHSMLAAWVSVVLMNALGPVFAWLTVHFSQPSAPAKDAPAPVAS